MSLLPTAPVRIDADLYDDLANPARQSLYPRDSRGFIRIDISLRAYWHTLFDTCPRLLELSGPSGGAIFLPFMAWARENNLAFDWSFFLWVYVWLQQSEFRERLDEDQLLPVMTASATRWLMIDRDIDACQIVLGSRSLAGAAVVGAKIDSIHCRLEQVQQVEFEKPLPLPDGEFGYFLTPGFEIDHFPGWRPLPR
ncbi:MULTISPECIES: methanobactin biosynthesis protein MbnC [Methylosinus]|uniref:Methanobactin biosynthesis cassette protein MbnC n=1 Tax=Methylosinus trichosporium (strain ATCC 35070 / NCIMB 11131 / UNIQEM 75 / OB3b) TaxID=595536 RepID=A0A2D2CY73_METT3|nr:MULTISPECIES: methanobactin biosynthesis protein MbnC [Methylosinus]ATQ67691.1 methanobactin biosynthesis cassette protein MbnC [Methylosinus trichosporium OB3b]OBS53635.1 methanobactin biosynthesis cassette protein MbnC [Methylosinus sp. 3S-1]